MTEYGYAMGKPQLVNIDVTDGDVESPDDDIYIIERIVRAERIGNLYKLWIKWKGHEDITPRWRHELVKEISDPDLLTSIGTLVQEAKEQHKLEMVQWRLMTLMTTKLSCHPISQPIYYHLLISFQRIIWAISLLLQGS